jgi:hypothetical protein
MGTDGKQKLDHAVDDLEREVPGKIQRFIEWARSDRAKWVRIPLALTLIAVGVLGPYLPIVGIEDNDQIGVSSVNWTTALAF